MQLLSDLEIVRSKVVPCYPEDYDILNFYVHEYALVSQAQVYSWFVFRITSWKLFTTTPTWNPAAFSLLLSG